MYYDDTVASIATTHTMIYITLDVHEKLVSAHPNITFENVATLRTNLIYYTYTKQDNYYSNLIIFQIYRALYMALTLFYR